MRRSMSILCLILSVFCTGLSHAVETSTAGDLVGQFQVDNGVASYNIPIAVPAGTTGVQPDLMLGYSSSGGNGIMGSGWGLGGASISSITECPKTIAQDGIVSGPFGSGKYCLDGMRLVAVNGSYGAHGAEYRTEIDSGVKVVSYIVDSKISFRVWTKAGLLKEYGRSDNSTINDSQANTLSWSIDRITDTMGNYMVYDYYQPADKSYSVLSKISYTGNYNTGLAPYAYVSFVYEDRLDQQFDIYQNGAKFRQPKRLKEVVSYIKNESGAEKPYRKYKITYKVSDFVYPAKESQVEFIEECTASDICTAPTFFNMTQGVRGNLAAGDVKNGISHYVADSHSGANIDISRLIHVDLNGDGKQDIYKIGGWGTSAMGKVYLSNGDGTYVTVNSGVTAYVSNDYNKAEVDIARFNFGDFDGDGNLDIYYINGRQSSAVDYIYFGNGNGTFRNAISTNINTFVNDGSLLGVSRYKFADINGDGRTDIYYARGSGNSQQDVVYLSSGGAVFNSVTSGINSWINSSSDGGQFDIGRIKLFDMNADGLPDVYYTAGWNGSSAPVIYFNDGDGTFSKSTKAAGVQFYLGNDVEAASIEESRKKFGDFNGDGLVDIYFVNGWGNSSEDYIYFGKGDGSFSAKTHTGITSYVNGSRGGAKVDIARIIVADINNDGLSDLYTIGGYGNTSRGVIYLGKGDGTFYRNDSQVAGINLYVADSYGGALVDINRVSFIDHDGDGVLDVYVVNGYGSTEVNKITINPTQTSVLSKIVNGSGVEIDIEYKKLTDNSVYEIQPDPCWSGQSYICLRKMQLGWTPIPPRSHYPNIEITTPMNVVSRVGSSDGVGGANYTNYKYYDLKVNAEGRGSFGFGKIEVLDETTQGKVVTEYSQTWPIAGIEKKSETYIYKDEAYIRVNQTHNQVQSMTVEGGLSTRVEPYYNQSKGYTIDGEELSTTSTEYSYDEYGNVLQVTQRIIDYTDSSRSMEKITDNLYDNFPSKWHLGRLRRATVTHKLTGHADKVNTTEFTYDRGTGLLEREIVEPDNPELYSKTEYTRDAYGNITNTKITSNKVTYDANGSAQYASSGQDPSVENAGYTSVYMTKDPASQWYADHPTSSLYIPIMMGGITIFIDNPNYVEPEPGPGLVPNYGTDSAPYEYPESWSQYVQDIAEVTSGFDSRGRFPSWSENQLGHRESYVYDQVKGVKTSQTDANGNTVSWVYDDLIRLVQVNNPDGTWGKTSYHRHSNAYPFMVKTTNSAGSETIVYQDIIRRNVISQAKDFQGNWKVGKKIFNKQGQLEREYPGFTPSMQQADYSNYNFDLEDRYVDYEYDVVSRPTKAKLWHGVRGEYLVTETIYGRDKTTQVNAKGQKSVTYTDIVTGKTTAVEEHKGTEVYTTQYRYDVTGKLIETEDALGNITSIYYDDLGRKIAMDDKDLGHWEYRYNSFGKMAWQKDAKGQIVTFNYDELGRTVQRSEPESITTWVYDTRANGIGKLAYINKSNNGYREDVYYDGLGRVQTTTTTIDGESYSTTTTYDAQGRPDTLTYPTVSGLSDIVVKNHYQLGSKAYKQTDALTGASYWELNEADEEHSKVTYGNGLRTIKTFDKYTSFMKGIDTGFYSEVQSLRYDYDDIGNVLSRKDNNQNLEETFGYDGLNRLTSYNVTGYTGRTVEYDAIGNITYKSDVGAYQYNSSRTHAVTNTGSQVHSYDANGNLYDTRTGSTVDRSVVWTSFNKPASMTKDGVTATYSYGAGHNRITKTKGSKKTTYVGSMYQKEIDGATIKHTYYVGSAVIKRTMINGSLSNESKNYLHKDHLGSVDVITDENGNVVERQSFDAWGKRRQSNNWNDALTKITSNITIKGYTGHEMDDDFDLVNMKGRIYDPTLGRFMSADPFVQEPGNPQNFNRYAYVLNNPLKYTDPSGYFFKKIKRAFKKIARGVRKVGRKIRGEIKSAGKSISRAWRKNWRTIGSIVVGMAAVTMPWISVVYSAAITAYDGGSFKDVLKSAAIAFVGQKLYGAIGEKYKNVAFLSSQHIKKTVLHGLVGGLMSKGSGGKFGYGFGAAAAGQFAAPGIDLIGAGSSDYFGYGFRGARITAAAIVGGTTSKLIGGKFANGAVTAAFARAHNDERHKKKREAIANSGKPQGEELTNSQLEDIGDRMQKEAALRMRAFEEHMEGMSISDPRWIRAEAMVLNLYDIQQVGARFEGGSIAVEYGTISFQVRPTTLAGAASLVWQTFSPWADAFAESKYDYRIKCNVGQGSCGVNVFNIKTGNAAYSYNY